MHETPVMTWTYKYSRACIPCYYDMMVCGHDNRPDDGVLHYTTEIKSESEMNNMMNTEQQFVSSIK